MLETADNCDSTMEVNLETDPEKDDYFAQSKTDVFVLLTGFSEKTNTYQIIRFLANGLDSCPVDQGVYGILFVANSEGLSSGKAIVRLKSVQMLESILAKSGLPLNKRPVYIKQISKTEGLAMMYNIKNKPFSTE